jgi:Tfp pilus assembly PilM family ATPase
MKLPWFLQSSPPDVAIELATRRVTAVAVAREGESMVVRASASVPLDEGVLVPVLAGPVVTQPDALAAALVRAIEGVGGAGRVALAVPDGLAKVSLVRFETLPTDHDELEQLVRWQVRKTAPFPVEQAQISWTPGAALDGGRELVVALARREGIVQIESACQRARVEPGLVDLASFHLANLLLARQPAPDAHDWLLVHLGDAGSTLLLLRGAALVFYRHRPVEEQTSLGDLVHQTAMYYEDRLAGRGLGRVVVVDDTDAGDRAAIDEIEGRLGMRAEAFALPSWVRFGDRAVAASAARLGAPLGALVREG